MRRGFVPRRISVVIVTWNVREYVTGCLKSLLAHAEGLDLEVIVVDNASTDGTADEVASAFPAVRLIRETDNRGFPAANNRGIGCATGEHLLLLNPDTEVQRGCLKSCLAVLEATPSIGMVGCKLVYPSGDIQYECACNMPGLVDVLIETFYLHVLLPHSRLCGRLRMSYWDHQGDRVVPRICGAFMLIRGDTYRKVGALDERFFMYYEDLDYCARVQKAGYKIYYLSSATTVHYGGKSREKSSLALDELSPEIKHTFFCDHRGMVHAFAYRVMCGVQCIVRIAIAMGIRFFGPGSRALNARPAGRVALHWKRFLWCLGLASRRAKAIRTPGLTGCDATGVVWDNPAP